MNYAYRVVFITNYLTIITTVELEAEDTFQNLSSEAYEQAYINAINNIEDEIGKINEEIIQETTITLLLDNEEIEVNQ